MADQKQGGQPQGGQPQGSGGGGDGGNPAEGVKKAQEEVKKAQEEAKKAQENAQEELKKAQEKAQAKARETLDKTHEYQKQLFERQSRYVEKYNAAWTTYYKNLEEATKSYQDTVKGIQEGARKATASQGSGDDDSPEKSFEAFKAARARNFHTTTDVEHQLRKAEREYNQKSASFWDDVLDSLSEAVTDFWDWINDWWQEPPVEGGGGPRRALADPAWLAALDPTAAYYSAGWNYAASLY